MIGPRATLLAGAIVLAGCGTTRTVRINVPVPIECRAQTPARPVMPLDALTPPYSVDLWVASAIAEREIREGYETELLAALGECTAPISAGKP